MTRKADGLRRKFQAVGYAVDDVSDGVEASRREAGGQRAEAADNLKNKLGELRPLFSQRGFGGGGGAPVSPEELAKPEPDFVLPDSAADSGRDSGFGERLGGSDEGAVIAGGVD